MPACWHTSESIQALVFRPPEYFGAAVARADTYSSVVPGQTLTVSDPSKGVMPTTQMYMEFKVSIGAFRRYIGPQRKRTFFLYANCRLDLPDTFVYEANGSSSIIATVTLNSATIENGSGITCSNLPFTSTIATYIAVKTPGLLAGCKDAAGYPLTLDTASVSFQSGPSTPTLLVSRT